MSYKIEIGGADHSVSLESSGGGDPAALLAMVEATYVRTRSTARQGMGFAGQHLERVGDSAIKGAGDYQRQIAPVTS